MRIKCSTSLWPLLSHFLSGLQHTVYKMMRLCRFPSISKVMWRNSESRTHAFRTLDQLVTRMSLMEELFEFFSFSLWNFALGILLFIKPGVPWDFILPISLTQITLMIWVGYRFYIFISSCYFCSSDVSIFRNDIPGTSLFLVVSPLHCLSFWREITGFVCLARFVFFLSF